MNEYPVSTVKLESRAKGPPQISVAVSHQYPERAEEIVQDIYDRLRLKYASDPDIDFGETDDDERDREDVGSTRTPNHPAVRDLGGHGSD